MADRFRELERPQAGRLKDVVLMATVTGFEGLRHPRRSDLKQFAELFEPLFAASSDEARRQAAAALSQCPHVPQSVALVIGNAPISIAAIFLTRSTSVDDATLLQIIRAQGPAHATAIARRENLSVNVVDALVERRQTASGPVKPLDVPAAADMRLSEPVASDMATAKLLREEKLRSDIKALARAPKQDVPAGPAIEPLNPLHEALLVRFARSGEANLFAASLAAALSTSLELGERILLDVSGQHLAIALTVLGMQQEDSLFVLGSLYSDLAERLGGTTRSEALLSSLTPETSHARLQAWLRTDEEETAARAEHQPYLAPERGTDPRRTPIARENTARSGALPQQQAFGRRG